VLHVTGSPILDPAEPQFRASTWARLPEVPMPKKRHTPEQIATALRQADAGITRKLGVHENTFYFM